MLRTLLAGTLFVAPASAAIVIDVLAGDKQFSTLVRAVTKAGLVPVLADKTKSFTVFAPTNAAFKKLEGDDAYDGLADDVWVLKYHVAAGAKRLKDGLSFNTLDKYGQELSISGSRGKFKVNGAWDSINILGQRKADNGVVYIIDEVLVPDFPVFESAE